MSNTLRLQPDSLRRFLAGAVALVALGFAGPSAWAAPLGELDPDQREVVESLALYDDELRRDALEAAGEADVLGALVDQQQRSSDTFRQLLDPYDRQVQEDLFELARYPDLVSEIVAGGPKSQKQLESIASRYPAEAATAAGRSAHQYWKVVARTDALLRDETASFEASIAHLPERKRSAFRSLVAAPDLLALLADNTGVAVLLGDAYDREPDAVLVWLDEVEEEVAAAGERETRELSAALDEDEELADQITASTAEYRATTGVSAYAVPAATRSSVVLHISPFPFWIGHPWWYASSYSYYDPWYYWYPRYAWSYGGSYFGPRFYASFGFGWPHSAFWGWYFHSPRHHHYYPRLTHHVVRHYDRHHRHRSRYDRRHYRYRDHRWHSRPGRHAVDRFVRNAEGSMPRGFLRDDGRRVERFREFGRLHEDDRRAKGERGARRGDRGRDRSDDLMRRARADGKRYPYLATLSRDPERSPRGERLERAEKRDRRARNPQREGREPEATRRERRSGSDRRADVVKGAGGAVRGGEPRGDRREPSARVDRKGESRRGDRGGAVEPRGERRRDDKRDAKREAKRMERAGKERERRAEPVAAPRRERTARAPREERRRNVNPQVESRPEPRAERRRDDKREAKREAKRMERAGKERERRAEPVAAPRRERTARAPREERRGSATPQVQARPEPRAEPRRERAAPKERRVSRAHEQVRGHRGGGDRGQRGGGGGKGGRGGKGRR